VTRTRIIAVSQIMIGLVFTNLVVIIGPVHLLAGAGLLIVGGLMTLVWPRSRAGRTIMLAGAVSLVIWSAFAVFFFRVQPPLVYVVVVPAVASIVMAFILGQGGLTRLRSAPNSTTRKR